MTDNPEPIQCAGPWSSCGHLPGQCTADPEYAPALPLDKLVDRWMMALGPEGSATHAGSVQVPADDLRRLVEALHERLTATSVFDVSFDSLADQEAWEERFKLFSVPMVFSYAPFHELGKKTQVKPRPFLRPAMRAIGTVDMGTHIAEAVFEEGPDGATRTIFVSGMKEPPRG